MRTYHRQQKGFTLIEVIAVLIIVGIMAAFAGLGIVTAVQGYIFSKDNAAISEKAQLAIARINRELLECYDCAGSGPINLPFYFHNTLGYRSINLSGTDPGNPNNPLPNFIVISEVILPSGPNIENTLLDTVKDNSLTLAYDNADHSISVQFVINRPGGPALTFSSRVYPRNTSF